MGTRADFYVGRGETAEWLGSIAWDGHPDSIDATVLTCFDEQTFRKAVARFLVTDREDGTLPEHGWPWPWEDSRTTDYAYAFDGGKVYASSFGCAWWDANEPEPDNDGPKVAVFPNMKDRQRVTTGKRSGVVVVGG